MRVILKPALQSFWSRNPDSERALQAWYQVATHNQMGSFAEVKAVFGSVDQVGDRLVFNVRGHAYRLIFGVEYRRGILFIKFIGTHTEYDRIDPKTVELK